MHQKSGSCRSFTPVRRVTDFRRVLACAVATICLLGQYVCAVETVRCFDSVVTVREDGTLLVSETIRVMAEGRRIKRGIHRDFPADTASFTVTSLAIDGTDSPHHHVQRAAGGIRVVLGDGNSRILRR